MAKQNITDYVQAINPTGYVNNREITNLPGQFLVKESQNCLIMNKEKVVSRRGYSLLGSAKTKNKGHSGSFDWQTNTNRWYSLRFNKGGDLEVYWKGDWHLLKTYQAGTAAEFADWWDNAELLDLLLFVTGDNTISSWSGGIANIASYDDTTLTKQGYLNGTTYSFNDNGALPDTIVASGITDPTTQGFLVAGFAAGDIITVSGSALNNNGQFTIASVTVDTITLIADDSLETEAAGPVITIGWLNNGSWAESRFLVAGTRKVLINGIEYAYTGGESTGTLTGLTGLKTGGGSVNPGDLVFQAIGEATPGTLAGFKCERISVLYNYVFIGSTRSRVVYISKSSDYTDFGYSTPRKTGEGFLLTLDSVVSAFVSSQDVMYISCARDDWYKITFALSQTTSGGEDITVVKEKSAPGQAALDQGSVVSIKNAVAYLSFEPTVDTLGRVEFIDSPQAIPISDDIRADLEAYDLTGAHGLYWRRNLMFVLPAEGIMIMFDERWGYWQPPQLLPLGRLALIDIEGDGNLVLCGHSSVCNESYRLFDGFSDNGATFKTVMAFGYENNGARFTYKQFDEAATELYMSVNTVVKNEIRYDYKGATDVRSFDIDGADDSIRFEPRVAAGPLGEAPLGSEPLGSVQDEFDDLAKYRVIDTTTVEDYFERQRVFSCDSPDQRWEIIAYGENLTLSDSLPTTITR